VERRPQEIGRWSFCSPHYSLRSPARDGLVKRISYLDILPEPRFQLDGGEVVPGGEGYYQIGSGNRLPLAELRRTRTLGPNTPALVSSPSDLHVSYAEQIAPHVGRTGIEKPLSTHGYQPVGC
jgi:hypothetical protein